MRYGLLFVLIIALAGIVPSQADISPGDSARYQVVSITEVRSNEEHPPVSEVKLLAGPEEAVDGVGYQWWELQVTKRSGEKFAFRVLSQGIPMTSGDKDAIPGKIIRYILKEGDAQPVEYLHARTGLAFLPKFDFTGSMCPVRGKFAGWQNGFATVGTYLGHMLALRETGKDVEWLSWPEPLVLRLNPELVVYRYGMSKDTDDRYITSFEDADYTYVQLSEEDVDELVSLGLNSVTVNDHHEEMVYLKPVLYYKATWSDSVGIKYPETLYRSNYRGATDFIDEPAHHMAKAMAGMKRPEEAGYLMVQHLQENWNRPDGRRQRTSLKNQLTARGINLGTFNIIDDDFPIWETVPETGFYQLMGGPRGILHEGRWQLREFNQRMTELMGYDANLTVDEMLRLYYADLRGSARAFGGSWGTSIYGQCDPEIAPRALTLAYDMGARYLWFWTFDRAHHLPYFMTKKLMGHLQEHVEANPRPPLAEMLYAPRTVIVLPFGYQVVKRSSDRMWGGIHLNEGNSAGVRHRDVVRAAIGEALAAMRAGEDFDFSINIGQDFEGYNRIVKIGLDAKVHDSVNESIPAELKAISLNSALLNTEHYKNTSPRVSIPYRPDIVVDGDLDEWENAKWLVLDKEAQYHPCPVLSQHAGAWDGPQDLSSKVTFARDEIHLYIAAEVTDNINSQRRADANIWQGDGIEVALDIDLHQSRRGEDSDRLWVNAFGGITSAPRYAEFAMANTPNGLQVYMGRCPHGTMPQLVSAKLAVERISDNRTIYEAAIPWSLVSTVPARFCQVAGLTFSVNDCDEEHRKGLMEFTRGIGVEKDPSYFALAEFAPIPDDTVSEVFAAITGSREVVDRVETARISIDSMLDSEKKAYLIVSMERADHTAASGKFDVALPKGRSRFIAELDISTVKPGVYVCTSEMRDSGDDTLIAESSFQILILGDSTRE